MTAKPQKTRPGLPDSGLKIGKLRNKSWSNLHKRNSKKRLSSQGSLKNFSLIARNRSEISLNLGHLYHSHIEEKLRNPFLKKSVLKRGRCSNSERRKLIPPVLKRISKFEEEGEERDLRSVLSPEKENTGEELGSKNLFETFKPEEKEGDEGSDLGIFNRARTEGGELEAEVEECSKVIGKGYHSSKFIRKKENVQNSDPVLKKEYSVEGPQNEFDNNFTSLDYAQRMKG